MKYQIYLNKQTSEIIEALAKASNMKSNTFIKDFIENCFSFANEMMTDEQKEEIRDYAEFIKRATK